MVEIDTSQTAEVRLLAAFLLDAAKVSTSDAPVSINDDPTGEPEIKLNHDAQEPKWGNNGTVAVLGSRVVPLDNEPAAPPPPGVAPVPEYDANGMPWDARIHSGKRGKTITGAWKARRGVDEAVRLAVEATLARGTPVVTAGTETQSTNSMIPPPPPPMAPADAPSAATPPAPLSMASAPPPPPSLPPVGSYDAEDDSDEVAPAVDLSALHPAPPPPPPKVVLMDFSTLMIKVSESMGSGKTTVEQVQAKLKPLGVDNLFGLNSRPDLVDAAARALGYL